MRRLISLVVAALLLLTLVTGCPKKQVDDGAVGAKGEDTAQFEQEMQKAMQKQDAESSGGQGMEQDMQKMMQKQGQ